MYIVLVSICVKEEYLDGFIKATTENAANSRKESGIARFDFIQQLDDPTRFILIEVYRSKQDTVLHKETAHYQKWRDIVAPMMAEDRSSEKYINIYPDDQDWN